MSDLNKELQRIERTYRRRMVGAITIAAILILLLLAQLYLLIIELKEG